MTRQYELHINSTATMQDIGNRTSRLLNFNNRLKKILLLLSAFHFYRRVELATVQVKSKFNDFFVFFLVFEFKEVNFDEYML